MSVNVSMIMMPLLLLVGLGAFILTGLLRSYALKRNLLDVPGVRSSHLRPTPRGGGMAIVLMFMAALVLLTFLDLISLDVLIALVGAGGWVALIGFVDDHGHISAGWRLLAHFLSAVWALSYLGGFPLLQVFGSLLDLGWLGHGLAAVYLVWLLNLYNFMDGIDGIAGIEALTVCLGGIVIHLLSSVPNEEWILPMLLLSASSGFLFWNFPRAKIFMGDVGSSFIGLVLGIFSIQAAWIDPLLFWGWVILLGTFIVDATVTLLRRAIRRERIYEAHRSHAYQHASRMYASHVKVSVVNGLINLGWLLPIASMVCLGWMDGLLGVLLAYMPLVLLTMYFNAGAKELQI